MSCASTSPRTSPSWTPRNATLAWPGLPTAVAPGEVLYLTDGTVRLRVAAVRDGHVDTTVELGGTVASHQGLNVPGELAALPTVAEEDLDMLAFGESIGVD